MEVEGLDQDKAIMRQYRLREIALRDGEGRVERTKYGAFIVYSRVSLSKLLDIVQDVQPEIQDLEQMQTIFLMGPTPKFYGAEEERATTSWRREFLLYAQENKSLNANWLIVLPEPYNCHWSSVDYSSLPKGGEEQVYAQIHWENHFIQMSLKKGVVVFHSHFRWSGNAGPTARFEGGFLIANIVRADRLCLNLSPDSQSTPYLEAHLSDLLVKNALGSFSLTRCSPLFVDENGQERELSGRMNVFFDAILYQVEKAS